MSTFSDWEREISDALAWWSDCFTRATNVPVKFRKLGMEQFVDNVLPEVGQESISRSDMTLHNIGDIRICAYDFWEAGCELDGVLVYAYKHQPCDYETTNSTCLDDDFNENGYLGNVYNNKSICWRKDSYDYSNNVCLNDA